MRVEDNGRKEQDKIPAVRQRNGCYAKAKAAAEGPKTREKDEHERKSL